MLLASGGNLLMQLLHILVHLCHSREVVLETVEVLLKLIFQCRKETFLLVDRLETCIEGFLELGQTIFFIQEVSLLNAKAFFHALCRIFSLDDAA